MLMLWFKALDLVDFITRQAQYHTDCEKPGGWGPPLDQLCTISLSLEIRAYWAWLRPR